MTEHVSTYAQAIEFLFGRINYERAQDNTYSLSDFKLERMRQFLERLGNPQDRIPVVHVAGTKGKGSTAVMIAEILSAAGYRTGLFTSPHISAFEERMTVRGVRPKPELLVDLVNRVIPVVDDLDRLPGTMSPTYFEIATALGWLYFVDEQAEIAVLEVGMGGRLDSTNICRPEVCVITSISFDHTAFLGETLAAIAGEKAGIIKPGVPVVSGVVNDEPRQVIRKAAETAGAKLYELGDAIQCRVEPHGEENGSDDRALSRLARNLATIETFGREPITVQIPLAGEHQARNAAVAIGSIDVLRGRGWKISDDEIHRGLLAVRWPARIEVLQNQPLVVVDAAHNVASVQALVRTLNAGTTAGRRILIFAGTKDKDIPGLLRELLPEFDSVILTQYTSNPRAMELGDLQQIAETISSDHLHAAADPQAAWRMARSLARPADLICVTGSFFIAAEIRELVLGEHPVSDDRPLAGSAGSKP